MPSKHHEFTTADELLRLKQEYVVPCVYHFYKVPPVIVAAQGCELIDRTGKRYIDCYSGVSVVNAGHCNPDISAVIAEQSQRLDHTTSIYLTEPVLQLAKRLADLTPGNLKRSFFCASGSEANEGAMLAARLHTGRRKVIALQDSLHGRTQWSMGVTGLEMWRTDPFPPEDVIFAPHAHCPRCPLNKSHPTCETACAAELEQRIVEAGPDTVAAVIAEPIQGNGGIVVPPDEYWPTVRQICDKYDILLIFDEIQTGMNRTGRWWSCEHWGVVPDVLTTAKALANGYPIAAFITSDEVAGSYTRPGASTFGGNPVAASAALATLDYHQEHALGKRAADLGCRLGSELSTLTEQTPCLSTPRGKGLMWGVDVVDADGHPDSSRLDAILEDLKNRGLFCGKTGRDRNVLTLMPPLVMEESLLKDALERIRASFEAMETKK